jgi:hypothetical protein
MDPRKHARGSSKWIAIYDLSSAFMKKGRMGQADYDSCPRVGDRCLPGLGYWVSQTDPISAIAKKQAGNAMHNAGRETFTQDAHRLEAGGSVGLLSAA